MLASTCMSASFTSALSKSLSGHSCTSYQIFSTLECGSYVSVQSRSRYSGVISCPRRWNRQITSSYRFGASMLLLIAGQICGTLLWTSHIIRDLLPSLRVPSICSLSDRMTRYLPKFWSFGVETDSSWPEVDNQECWHERNESLERITGQVCKFRQETVDSAIHKLGFQCAIGIE